MLSSPPHQQTVKSYEILPLKKPLSFKILEPQKREVPGAITYNLRIIYCLKNKAKPGNVYRLSID